MTTFRCAIFFKYCAVPVMTAFFFENSAHAQVSGSLTLVSDYAYRGISLSDGHAVPQLNLVYDAPNGWYAGIFSSEVQLSNKDANSEQIMSYAGFSRQFNSGLVWETGATGSLFPKSSELNYGEIFTGLTLNKLNARVFFSPNYIGQNTKTIYWEANIDLPLSDGIDTFYHVGWLQYLNSNSSRIYENRMDSRIGIAGSYSFWKLQLTYDITGTKNNERSQYQINRKNRLVFSASILF